MQQIQQNNLIEFIFHAQNSILSPTNLELNVIITDPQRKDTIYPGFWNGNNEWRFRYASALIGTYNLRTSCSITSETGLHNQTETFEIIPYTGRNPLFLHGKLIVNRNSQIIEHRDGTPFFWLGDTWWMGFTKRLKWPEDFTLLTKDRVSKGFTLVQIVAGLYPDMPPFDERGANEAGFPWQNQTFEELNPAYFDWVDKRVQFIVESGLIPCIVGFWGYFLHIMGVTGLKKHWRYLIARYGAYPIVWCIAGEAMMNYYVQTSPAKSSPILTHTQRLKAWSEIAVYIHNIDGFQNPITIHPTQYGHEQLDNPQLLDLNMLQTGHANPAREIQVIKNTVKMITRARKIGLPVIVGEVCYEGIMEANRQQIQRCLFWATWLSGGMGHTYGANGIWQVNCQEQPFGVSPHGTSWGNTPWEEAYKLLGSLHVALGKKILTQYEWWNLKPHPEWVKNPLTFAAGIPNHLRIIYRLESGRFSIYKLEKGVLYNASLVDPKNGQVYSLGNVEPNKHGVWRIPNPPIFQDWIVILEHK
jgi:hypothetical protein